MTKSLKASLSATTKARISLASGFFSAGFLSALGGTGAAGGCPVMGRDTAAAMLNRVVFSVSLSWMKFLLRSAKLPPGALTAKSILAEALAARSKLPEPKTTTAAAGALRLKVETDACDEKLLLIKRV